MKKLIQTLLMLAILISVCSAVVGSFYDSGKAVREVTDQQQEANTYPATVTAP